jgi:phosphoserine phosphatase
MSVIETLRGGKVIAISARAAPKLKTRTITIGTATVTLAAGASEEVTVRLTSAGRLLLKEHRSLTVKLTVTSGGTQLSTKVITLREPASRGSLRHGPI